MEPFTRSDTLFSLCGLNCGLCTMRLGHYCPGCGGGAGNQPCAIARCAQGRGKMEYCFLCDAYPCEKYDGAGVYDSFITHRNQLKDMEKARRIGLEAYHAEQAEKMAILEYLLATCNDGRRKSFFCLAVNLLELEDVRTAMEQIEAGMKAGDLTLKQKAILAADSFQAMAAKRGILLKLNRKEEK